MIDFYVKKHFDGLDITTILPFTTIQRIFNNREVRKLIGLDISDESTFTAARMQLVIDASKWIVAEAEALGIAVTRLFNKARAIEDKLIPWIQEYVQGKDMDDHQNAEQDKPEQPTEQNGGTEEGGTSSGVDAPGLGGSSDSGDTENSGTTGTADGGQATMRGGGNKNLPYFFQGINYGALDPNDAETHGVTAVCRELELFSDKRLVATYPIATTFLVRSIIEQTIIYYSKKHNIQGQSKLIWENIKDIGKLSKIIENYKRNLPNYITDTTMRQYFTSLFGNYEDNVDPLNWVVHRPAEFQLDVNTLVELPRKGLLSLINFMLS